MLVGVSAVAVKVRAEPKTSAATAVPMAARFLMKFSPWGVITGQQEQCGEQHVQSDVDTTLDDRLRLLRLCRVNDTQRSQHTHDRGTQRIQRRAHARASQYLSQLLHLLVLLLQGLKNSLLGVLVGEPLHPCVNKQGLEGDGFQPPE